MTHEELEEVIPLYAVGALEREERQALEAHLLSGCVSCHSSLREYQSVAAVLPFALPIVSPPPAVRSHIMAALGGAASQDAPVQQAGKLSVRQGAWMNRLFPPGAPAASLSVRWAIGLVLAATIGGGTYAAWTAHTARLNEVTTQLAHLQEQAASAGSELATLRQQLAERNQSLAQAQRELERLRSELVDLKDQLIQREAEVEAIKGQLRRQGQRQAHTPEDELAAILRMPTITAIELRGTAVSKRASGILLYDTRTQKAWLYALNLPESPAGMAYHLWAMDEQPVTLGTFSIGRGETSHLFVTAVPAFMSLKKFFVSLEPAGRQPQPKGPIYLLGQP